MGTNTTVAAAIEAYFAGLPALQALLYSGKLWHVEADLDEQLPYVTFHTASSNRQLTTGAPYLAEHIVQWSFHADSAAGAASLAQDFMSAPPSGFDRAPLVVNGEIVASAQAEDDGFTTIGEEKGPGGSDCYMHVVMYQVLIAASRK
jgi:hypothetical protein